MTDPRYALGYALVRTVVRAKDPAIARSVLVPLIGAYDRSAHRQHRAPSLVGAEVRFPGDHSTRVISHERTSDTLYMETIR